MQNDSVDRLNTKSAVHVLHKNRKLLNEDSISDNIHNNTGPLQSEDSPRKRDTKM